MWKPGFDPWVVNIPWRRAWQPTPVFLTGESPWTEPSGLHANYRVTKSRPRRSGQHSTQLIYNIVSGSGVQRSDSVLYKYIYIHTAGLPGGTNGKKPTCQGRPHKRLRFNPWVGKIPWRREWQPTPVFSPGKFHGRGESGRQQSTGSQRIRHD